MKILNFGSLNLDYVYRVRHFVRAGETISSQQRTVFCGGKGLNQSIAFAKAGATVYHAGSVGSDGGMLTDMLAASDVHTDFVRTLPDVPTGHAMIQVNDEGENCILLYGGANQAQDEAFIDEVLSHFSDGDLLMLQNEINASPLIAAKAKQKGMQIALNPSPMNEGITEAMLNCTDYLILNETEGCEITQQERAEDILAVLRQRYPTVKIILTLGKHGSIYDAPDLRCTQSIFPVKAVDTTAAGDTFTGYFFASLTSGQSPAVSLKIASAASAIAVSRMGAAPSIPEADEVSLFLSQV